MSLCVCLQVYVVFKVILLPWRSYCLLSTEAQGLITAHFISGGKLRVKAELSLTASISTRCANTHIATYASHAPSSYPSHHHHKWCQIFYTAFMIEINHVFVTFFRSHRFYLLSLFFLCLLVHHLFSRTVIYLCSFSTPGQQACDLYIIKAHLSDMLYLLSS